MLFYALPAVAVCLLCVDALRKDDTTPNDDVNSWLFIAVAALAWPICLPSILRKKLQNWQTAAKTRTQLREAL
ncbi:MAG TPA: hypothetical protein V6D02_01965 [Candidatus Obscuribacterales bacterium]